MSLTHYINGQQVNEPIGAKGLKQEITRKFNERIVLVQFSGTVTFTGKGYRILRDLFEAGTCTVATYEAFEECAGVRRRIISSAIVLTDCEWNLNRCEVDCSITDKDVGDLILSNWNIPIIPTSTLSKTETAITPVAFKDIELFDTTAPIADYLADTRGVCDWYDCLQHAVQYVTDGAVPITSAWYAALPDDERIALCSGVQLRTHINGEAERRVTYTLKELFTELAISYNLFMIVTRDINGNVLIRVEPEIDLYDQQVAFDMLHQDNLIQSIDTDRLYGSVRVGSEDGLANIVPVQSLPYIQLQTFSEEHYHFAGQCNTDQVLEIVGKWQRCTNLIQRTIGSSSDELDGDIFLIQYDHTTDRATKGDYFNPGSTPYLYNEELLNINILNRFSLPSGIVQPIEPTTAQFRASSVTNTGQQTLTALGAVGSATVYTGLAVSFSDDYTFPPNFDTGNNWGNGTPQGSPVPLADQRYTAPAQGYYQFGCTMIRVINSVIGGCVHQVRCILERRDSLGILIETQFVNSPGANTIGTFSFTAFIGLVLNTGDYITHRWDWIVTRGFVGTSSATGFIGTGSSIFTQYVATGGGTIATADPTAARLVKYNFDRITPIARWRLLLDNPALAVRVSPNASSLRQCYISKVSRDVITGETSWEIISNRQTNPL